MSAKGTMFFDINNCKREEAEISIISAPLEKTTSYQKGTSVAPKSILEASFQLEDYDIETRSCPFGDKIYNAPEIDFNNLDMRNSILKIEELVTSETKRGVFPLVLGGEHSISVGVFKGLKNTYNELGVVHFDAHGDLRNSYEEEPLSHACVLRRIRELTKHTLSVGIRSICSEEVEYIEREKPSIVYAHEFIDFDGALLKFNSLLRQLPEKLFITFDVDVFDPSVIAHTGTPEPGGLSWYQILSLLKLVFKEKKVVGADIVELMPRDNSKESDFTIAKLVGKMIAYKKFFS